jgi:hypothetical protein
VGGRGSRALRFGNKMDFPLTMGGFDLNLYKAALSPAFPGLPRPNGEGKGDGAPGLQPLG